jgi:hypothetical protein
MLFNPHKIDFTYHKIRDDGGWQMYDAHCWYEGKGYIGIEYKVNRLKTAINMPDLFKDREHQIKCLKDRKRLGNTGWVLINWWVKNKINRCFWLSPETAEKYLKGTVSMKEFIEDKEVIELSRHSHNKRYYWNLLMLFK